MKIKKIYSEIFKHWKYWKSLKLKKKKKKSSIKKSKHENVWKLKKIEWKFEILIKHIF